MFIETIRYSQGRFHLLDLHEERMARTIREVYGFSATHTPALHDILSRLPEEKYDGVLKCRITYDTEIRDITFTPYIPRSVNSLMPVIAPDNLDYHLKQSDRSALTALSDKRGDCDEILIIRNGLITDTSYSNVIFKSRSGLITPRMPLLKGVMRRHLINKGIVEERNLTISDLLHDNNLGITEVYLINAMLPPGTSLPIPIDRIRKPG